jgi:hypothetical protein
MNITILDEITFNPNPARVLMKLRVKPDSHYEEMVLGMLEEASQIARPKAMYSIAGIDEKFENGVVIEGIRMESKVMSTNLQDVNRVFPYLQTSGRELYDWKMGFEDMLDTYYADEINQIALRTAERYLLDHFKNTYQLGKTASMNPGSLEDWPITAQQSLFQLLGDPLEAIGVELLDSMLMVPNQTVSGIRFVSEAGYSNCELCPREPCPSRRAPYNPELMGKKYD